jgi:predicted chitinase
MSRRQRTQAPSSRRQESPAPARPIEAATPAQGAVAPSQGAVVSPTPTLDAAAVASGSGYVAPASIDAAALDAVVAAVLVVVPADQATQAAANLPLLLRQSAEAGVTRPDEVAYLLATAEHESGYGASRFRRSEPLVEDHNPYVHNERKKSWSAELHAGSRAGRVVSAPSEAELDTLYWDSMYGGRLGNEKGTADAANYRGRGFVQLTGRSNYAAMSEILNAEGFTYSLDGQTFGGPGGAAIDLVTHFDHVNRVPALASRILVEGSIRGTFTGVKLSDAINDEGTDFVDARAVINGTDRAEDIAAIANRYARVLRGPTGWATVFGRPAVG